MLTFGAESFAFQFATKKFKDIQNYKFACFLYGCETWSLALKEERRVRVFEDKVLRRIFGPKRDEVTRKWRKLHNRSLTIFTPHPILFG